MDEIENALVGILRGVLGPNIDRKPLGPDSALVGEVAELDSMAVVAVLTAIEEHFGVVVADDEIDGSTFATVGSLAAFVRSKLET